MKIQPTLAHDRRLELAKMLRTLRAAVWGGGRLQRQKVPFQLCAVPAYRGFGSVFLSTVSGWNNHRAARGVETAEPADPSLLGTDASDDFHAKPPNVAEVLLKAMADGLDLDSLTIEQVEEAVPYEQGTEPVILVRAYDCAGDEAFFEHVRLLYDEYRRSVLKKDEDAQAYQLYLGLRARFEAQL